MTLRSGGTWLLVLGLFFGGLTSSVHAGIIDTFDNPFSPGQLAIGATASSAQTGLSGVFGGEATAKRTGTLTQVIGDLPINITAEIAANKLSFDSGSGDQGTLTLDYTDFTPFSVAGVEIEVPLFSYNSGNGDPSLDVILTLTSALGSATGTIVVPGDINSPTILSFIVGSLTPSGAFDSSLITGISFVFAPKGLGADLTIGGADSPLRITNVPIPEPTSLALWGLIALSGGVLVSRRQQHRASV